MAGGFVGGLLCPICLKQGSTMCLKCRLEIILLSKIIESLRTNYRMRFLHISKSDLPVLLPNHLTHGS